MAEDKTIALLNGIAANHFLGDVSVTQESLKSELFPDISSEEFERLSSKMKYILSSMASSDMGLHQLEAFLASQVKKRDNPITDEQSKSILKFWTNNKARIHSALAKRAVWNPTVESYRWRVDTNPVSKNSRGIGVPTAILEIKTENNLNKEKELIQLEFDENSLTTLITKMEDIEKCITEYCKS